MTQIKVLLLLWLVILIFDVFFNFKAIGMTNTIHVSIHRYHLNIDHQYNIASKIYKKKYAIYVTD